MAWTEEHSIRLEKLSRCLPERQFYWTEDDSKMCEAAHSELAELRDKLGKLYGAVKTWLEAPPMVKGEAFRDLTGTFDWIDGRELYGWPQVYERLETKYKAMKERAEAWENCCVDAQRCMGTMSKPYKPEEKDAWEDQVTEEWQIFWRSKKQAEQSSGKGA